MKTETKLAQIKAGDIFTRNDKTYLARYIVDHAENRRTIHAYHITEGGIVVCEERFYFSLSGSV